MNNIVAFSETSEVSMTSREIADLTGKRHADVLRDIDNLTETLNAELRLGFKPSTYVDSTGKSNRQFTLDRDATYCLVTGYDPNARMRIIKRWQELEAKPVAPQMLPAEVALRTLECNLRIMDLLGVPKSFGVQETAKMMTKQSGVDYTALLTQAACMTGVTDPDVYLEPTELGKLFDLSAVAMNRKLCELGFQVKVGGQWTPTEAGSAIAVRHAWVSGNKSGYNLKWKAEAIEQLFVG